MTLHEELDQMVEDENPEALFLEPREFLDQAIIGMSRQHGSPAILLYDPEKVVEGFMAANDWSYETALEWADFNTFCAYVGPGTPAFLYRPPDSEFAIPHDRWAEA